MTSAIHALVLAPADRHLADLQASRVDVRVTDEIRPPDLAWADLVISEELSDSLDRETDVIEVPQLTLVPAALSVDYPRRPANSYLAVPAQRGRLAAAIVAAAQGLLVRDPVLDERDRTDLAEPLTARERDVLALLARGCSNPAMAELLSVSDNTVKTHVAAVLGKLGAHSRTEAVALAARRGLVML